MSNIQHKLKENKSRIRREKFLSASDSKFSDFLSHAEYCSEISCIKNAAFPKWDKDINIITTSRGELRNWNNFKFKTWQELIAMLKKFHQVKNYIGWFFIEDDGPFFKISLNAFLSHIQHISNYGIKNAHYNFVWVGDIDDVGIIIGENPSQSNGNKFNISIWGI